MMVLPVVGLDVNAGVVMVLRDAPVLSTSFCCWTQLKDVTGVDVPEAAATWSLPPFSCKVVAVAAAWKDPPSLSN